jgi:beta-glucosidase
MSHPTPPDSLLDATPEGSDPRLAAAFPADFTWGAATASFQVEGATHEGGRGPSIWDTFCAEPGRVVNGDNGDVAVDHYHRYPEDVALMARLGLGAYRFSFAWPRLQPTGSGALNPAGVDFYDRLVDALLEAGITPSATLYHWDLPQALQDAGGWPARDTVARFTDHAVAVHAHFSDRIRQWATFNEPWCSAFLGHQAGVHAPGASDARLSVPAAHHLLLAHGSALQAIRATSADPGRLGIVLNLQHVSPETDDPADVDAARRVDAVHNRLWLGALFDGAYPQDLLDDVAPLSGLDHVHDGDLQTIAQPLDWVGLNYYCPAVVTGRADQSERGEAADAYPGCGDVRMVDRGRPTTDMGWEVDPQGFRDTLAMLSTAARKTPIHITENGAAYRDQLVDGAVHDADRVAYLRTHLEALARARADGIDVRGYFVWSLLDNFEWAWGYGKRFGVVHVDYDTQVRTPKDSALWYAGLLAHHRAR